MKRTILLLIVSLVGFSCKGQKIVLDVKNKDVVIFQDEKSLLKSTNLNSLKIDSIVILSVNWAPIGSSYNINKYFSFYNKADTMTIKCKCGQERNYYFKNLDFKKGNYELSFELPRTKNLFREIDNVKKIPNVFFKNTYVPEEDITIKDSYLKDLKFYEVDFNDTINVKLRKIENPSF